MEAVAGDEQRGAGGYRRCADHRAASGWALVVDTVELLGAERLIYARVQGGNADEQLVVRVEEGTFTPNAGDVIHVTPRPDRIHTFDANTSKRI